MRIIQALIMVMFLMACSSNVEEKVVTKNEVRQRAELSKDSKIFLGNRLFSEKTCITCHAIDKEKIGPSVVDIMKIYSENKASIEDFLQGKSLPIVDTTASQVAIMQENIEGFLKKVTDEELNAIAVYMMHTYERYGKE